MCTEKGQQGRGKAPEPMSRGRRGGRGALEGTPGLCGTVLLEGRRPLCLSLEGTENGSLSASPDVCCGSACIVSALQGTAGVTQPTAGPSGENSGELG